MTPQIHCHHHHPKKQNYLNFEYVTHACQENTSAFTVGAANNTPACQLEALPARYRRTASISTYTHTYGEQLELLNSCWDELLVT
jgi:hypothetical protein